MNVTAQADQAGRRADNSEWMDHAVRVGLVSYGIVHLVLAWLTVELVIGGGGGSASNQGALQKLAQNGLGKFFLYVAAAGFVALVVWQVIEATWGHRDEDGGKRVLKRVISAAKVVIYGASRSAAFKTASGSSSGGGGTDGITSKLMNLPAGPLLVGAVGVGHRRGRRLPGPPRLEGEVPLQARRRTGKTGKDGKAYILFGKVGYIAKGVAFAVVGLLFLYAAITHDSSEVRRARPGAAQGPPAAVRRTDAARDRGRLRVLRLVLLRLGTSPRPVRPASTHGFDTERLVVRSWHLADADAFFDIYRRWEVARWLGAAPRALETLDEAEARVTRWAELNRSGEVEGRWAVQRREDGRVLGTVLLVGCPTATASSRSAGTSTPTPGGTATPPRRPAARATGGSSVASTRSAPSCARATPPSVAVCARLGMEPLGRTSRYYDSELELFRSGGPRCPTGAAAAR